MNFYTELSSISVSQEVQAQFSNHDSFDLDSDEINELATIFSDSQNHGQQDLRKKCRFDPDVKFTVVKLNLDLMTVLICTGCKTWELKSGRNEYFGNYDRSAEKVDLFLDELFRKVSNNQQMDGDKQIASNGNGNYVIPTDDVDSSKFTSILIHLREIATTKGNILLEVTTEPESPNSVTQKYLGKDKLKVVSLIQEELNKGVPSSIRMCAEPISQQLSFTSYYIKSLDVYLSSNCGQLTLISNEFSMNIENPSLVDSILQILEK